MEQPTAWKTKKKQHVLKLQNTALHSIDTGLARYSRLYMSQDMNHERVSLCTKG